MLEKVDLTRELSKQDYKARLPHLRNRLYDLQKACWDANMPTVIIFEGWDAAGKGTSINLLTQRLDPRGFKLYAIQAARTVEMHMPWLWRFWLKLPNYGEMAIFDRSWYGRVLVERVEKLTPVSEWRKGYRDIVDFERAIADDGTAVVKFWLHISKKEQRRRFKRLEKDPLKSWHVQPEDWEHHRRYNEYLLAVEEMLERTDTEWGPWTIVEATDRRWARVKIFETIIRRLEEALEAKGLPLPPERPSKGVGEPETEESETPVAAEEGAAEISPAAYEVPLTDAGLGSRVLGPLLEAGLATVGDVAERLREGDDALLQLEGIGPRSLEKIKQGISALAEPEPQAEPEPEAQAQDEEV
jgi:polyphosphate kinase 2 (PPK2 family)